MGSYQWTPSAPAILVLGAADVVDTERVGAELYRMDTLIPEGAHWKRQHPHLGAGVRDCG